MAGGPISGWFIGWLCGKLADKALRYLVADKDLASKLDKAVTKWADSLSEDKYINPNTLFVSVDHDAENVRPKHYQLQQMLVDGELPSQELLLEVFIESWRHVRDNITEPQAFFTLSEEQAAKELQNLARDTFNPGFPR